GAWASVPIAWSQRKPLAAGGGCALPLRRAGLRAARGGGYIERQFGRWHGRTVGSKKARRLGRGTRSTGGGGALHAAHGAQVCERGSCLIRLRDGSAAQSSIGGGGAGESSHARVKRNGSGNEDRARRQCPELGRDDARATHGLYLPRM